MPKQEPLGVPLWPEFGEAMGICRNTAYAAARRGDIPVIRIGRTIRVPMWYYRQLRDGTPKPVEAA